jgi:hypothetical protein
MADNMRDIRFDYSSIEDLQENLRKLRVEHAPTKEIFCTHTLPLFELGRRLNVKSVALHNMYGLAKGHRDLALLTLEPADHEDTRRHTQLYGLPQTVQILNDGLEDISRGRSWKNTCIIDIRSFRSDKIRRSECVQRRKNRDELAYAASAEAIDKFQPRVLVIHQSATAESENEFAQTMSSSVHRAGHVSLHQTSSGKSFIVIYSFHPMYAARHPNPMIRELRLAMIKFNLLQAVNLLEGRLITGPGMFKLQNACWGANQEPHCLLSNGLLDPTLDRRFKGVFIASTATSEMKRIYRQSSNQRRKEVSAEGYTWSISDTNQR